MKTLKRVLFSIFLPWMAGLCAYGQTAQGQPPTTVEGWADRLQRFGKAIPQEKVFVHMDNTCYFLGDTIWFAAYTRRTDKATPSNISRILYVELLNQDGFLVERQLIEMKGGRGHGNFCLHDTLYGGFYELRAYTRWQLNWGITEKEHTADAERWFFSEETAQEFYRDYDKLYSRVFPVYDKPETPGDFYHDMTTRPLRRYFKSGAAEPQLQLSLFPEGGHAVAGLPCRVAFEAATEAGEAVEGKILPLPSIGREQIAAEGVPTVSRGRGVFTFTPEAGQDYEFTFTDKDGRTAKAKLPAVESDGVALHVQRQGDAWELQVAAAGAAAAKPLGMTIMHEGRVMFYQEITERPSTQIHYTPLQEGQGDGSGLYQATVFDADGRIYADRLFFVTTPELLQPTLTISDLKDKYEPFEQVNLQVTAPSLAGRAGGESPVSLAIRDASTEDYTYDTGNILTEMLLASELKGFIPQPSYFFEADDEEHRTALDLLTMTQGWRRFDWFAMATPGAFALTQPAETQTQLLRGEVLSYENREWQDDLRAFDDSCPLPYQLEKQILTLEPDGSGRPPEQAFRKSLRDADADIPIEDKYTGRGQGEIIETIIAQTYTHETPGAPAGSYRLRAPIAGSRFSKGGHALPREMQLHAEFIQPGSESILGDVETKNGAFTIQAPRFDGYCVFFLSASDATRWKDGQPHTWVSMQETDAPEYYVRVSWPYPRFTQPYTFYQTAYRPAPKGMAQTSLFNPRTFETNMQTVTVRASHGGLRRLDPSKPAFTQDAYQAFNDACDAGLMEGRFLGRFHYINSLARLYAGDMQSNNAYLLEPRYDGSNISTNRTPAVIDRYNLLSNLESVRIYTDYNPRSGGDPRAKEDNVERMTIDLRQLPDEGQRVTYRDRRYVLQGFNVADDFYHPDYRRSTPAEGAKDYRRTLYWNPDLQLDDTGKARVTFFNGSTPTTLKVEANGQTADGQMLTN